MPSEVQIRRYAPLCTEMEGVHTLSVVVDSVRFYRLAIDYYASEGKFAIAAKVRKAAP